MKWYRKVIIALGSLILLVLIVNIALNLWIKLQLPKIINRENNSAYFITYKNLQVSLLHSTIKAAEIVIVPKAAIQDSVNKSGIYAKVKGLEIKDFKVWNLVFSHKLKARSITIEQPKLILYSKNKKSTICESVVAPFKKVIVVSDVFLNHGNLQVLCAKNKKPMLSVHNVNMQLKGIIITNDILKNKIPFKFRTYAVNCDSLYYHPNEFYHIQTKKIQSTPTNLDIVDLKLTPAYSRREFVAKIPKEQDLYTLRCKSLKVDNMNWGFKQDAFFFHCNTIKLESTSANIYRSLEPADDMTKRKFYNTMLRDMTFDLKINTLTIRNSILEYEEEKSFDIGAAKIVFNPFNLTATNVSSGFKKTTLPDIKIKINSKLMNNSPLIVNWKFNVMDQSDGFNINGKLTNLDAERIVPFSKPYLNMTMKGILDEVSFNFIGNDKGCEGTLRVEYHDLKFTIYKKDDRKKKNKLMTFIAGIFVKKDTNDKLRDTVIKVEHIPEKSFYNLMWRSIAEGFKKILV